jgi:hypothetical protein
VLVQWKREWTAPVVIGVISFVSGAVTTMVAGVVTTLTFKKQFEDEDPEELREVINHFNDALVEMNYRTQEQERRFTHLVDEVKHVLRGVGGEAQRSFDEYAVEIRSSIPPDKASGWDHQKEVASRTTEAPYVISAIEYGASENGYYQSTLTYYKGDDILCDPTDTPIYNKDKVVGELKFGHGSNDPSAVYIRNDTLKAEYEVLLEPGHYTVQVLGQEMEDNLNDDLKHFHQRKFRTD